MVTIVYWIVLLFVCTYVYKIITMTTTLLMTSTRQKFGENKFSDHEMWQIGGKIQRFLFSDYYTPTMLTN